MLRFVRKEGFLFSKGFYTNFLRSKSESLSPKKKDEVVLNFYDSSDDFLWFHQNPGMLMAYMIIFSGGFVGLFSAGILMKWVGMEIMFFGVVALMSRGSSIQVESATKYFIIQGLGGMIIFLSMFCLGWVCSLAKFSFLPTHTYYYYLVWSFLLIGFCLKLGLFPFDYWVPGVFKSSSYLSCFLMGGLQKLLPLYILSGLGLGRGLEILMMSLGFFTALKSCIMGLGIKDVRLLLGYSSLVQLGWMIVLCMNHTFWLMLFLVSYYVVMGIICLRLYDLNVYNYWDLYGVGISKLSALTYLWYDFLSLAGIPISVGWVPKLVGVYCLKESIICVVLLSVCTGITTYMYLSLGFEMAWYLGFDLSSKIFHSLKNIFSIFSLSSFSLSSIFSLKGAGLHYWLFIFGNLVSVLIMVILGIFS